MGMNTFRIGFLMERLVPDTLTGSIDEAYFSGLESVSHVSLPSKTPQTNPLSRP
jgi:hypothetical protein